MKKISISILCLLSVACSKSKDNVVNPQGNCDGLSEKYVAALNAYAANQSVSNCQTFKTSLNDLVTKCAILTAQQKSEYNTAIADLKCN